MLADTLAETVADSRAASLGQLRRLFTWTDPGEHAARCGALERNHLTAVAAAINHRLDPGVRDALEALPDDAYLSILRGCDTFFAALHAPADQLADRVTRWITVERAVPGAPAGPDGTLRAADCRRHVVIAGGRVIAIDRAPRLPGSQIALDFTSELPSRLVARFAERPLAPPTQDARAEIADKLGAALALLGTASPLARDFVCRMIDVICCRTAPGDDRFYTASDQSTLGAVHLVNTHLARKTPSAVAAELVHEAIHQAVFRHELVAPLFPDPADAIAPATSPWTGAPLELSVFVHACFVWYGVARLWHLPTAAALPVPGRQIEIARAGFARQPLAHLGPLAARLSPALRAVIADMTDDILHPAREQGLAIARSSLQISTAATPQGMSLTRTTRTSVPCRPTRAA